MTIGGILPVLGFVSFYFQQFSSAADRYSYLSVFGLSFLMAHWIAKNENQKVTKTVTLALVLVFAGLSFKQSKVWKNDEVLWTHVIETSPGQPLAHTNRGIVFHNKGEFTRALNDYNLALEIDPELARTYGNRGNTYAFMRQTSNALKDFTKAIELDPTYARAYGNRAVAYFQTGRFLKAKRDLDMAMELGYQPHPQFVEDLGKRLN